MEGESLTLFLSVIAPVEIPHPILLPLKEGMWSFLQSEHHICSLSDMLVPHSESSVCGQENKQILDLQIWFQTRFASQQKNVNWCCCCSLKQLSFHMIEHDARKWYGCFIEMQLDAALVALHPSQSLAVLLIWSHFKGKFN